MNLKVSLIPRQNSTSFLYKTELKLFNFITVIGKGGFGKVWKLQTESNHKLFALK